MREREIESTYPTKDRGGYGEGEVRLDSRGGHQMPITRKPGVLNRREQLLAQAKLTRSFEPAAQRSAVSKLMLESVLSGACTSEEILAAAYDDPLGYRYWEHWLFEPVQIYQFAELLALHNADIERAPILDRYLLQIFERLRAPAEAGETWFIGDRSLLVTESWSSLALRNGALAVRPREAIAWMCQNPNARALVPATAGQIAGSIESAPTPSPALSAQIPDATLNAEIEARSSHLPAVKFPKGLRRGRRAIKLDETKEKMRRDIQEGRETADTLKKMLEKDLAFAYGVSRDTARKARNAVLSEIVANSDFDK